MRIEMKIRYCIFHRKPWFLLGYVLAANYEEAMSLATTRYDCFPNYLKREDLQVAPSMAQHNLEQERP